MPYADKIRSYSKPGEGADHLPGEGQLAAARDAQIWYTVRKKIGDMRATLPAGVVGALFNDEFGDVYGVIYALSATASSARAARGRRPTSCASACSR